MTRTLARSLLPLLAFAIGLTTWGAPSSVAAQTSVHTCNAWGGVTSTVLGISNMTPISCLGSTNETSPGEDKSSLVGTTTLGLGGFSDLVGLEGASGDALWTQTPSGPYFANDYTGKTKEVGLHVLDLINLTGVGGKSSCHQTPGSATVPCEFSAVVESITVNGQSIPPPSQPIAMNTVVPISDLQVPINILGLNTIATLEGKITFNQVKVSGQETQQAKIEQAAAAINLSGRAQVGGIGLVDIKIDIQDYVRTQIQDGAFPAGLNVIPVAVMWDGNDDDD